MIDRKIGIPDDTMLWDDKDPRAFAPDLWWLVPKIKECHKIGVDGRGVKFSVNDTGGVDDHPGFSKKPFEITTTIRGVNPRDRNGHGTACSFIVNQIAPAADYMTIKVLGDGGSGTMNDINEAYALAAEKGCDFINCSYGDNGGPPIQSDLIALEKGYESGASLIVVAAGNASFNGQRNSIGRPASYDQFCWCQGATDRNGRISGFSSGGPHMDAATFGQDMPFATPSGGYSGGSGTSFACPFMVGVFCLAQQARRMYGMNDLIGPAQWKEWFVEEEILVDAGAPGFDPSYGMGIPAIDRLLDWILKHQPENL